MFVLHTCTYNYNILIDYLIRKLQNW